VTFTDILQLTFWDNTVLQWGSAALVLVAVMVGQRVLQRVIIDRVRRFTETSQNTFDDMLVNMLDDTNTLLVFVVALYLGAIPLTLPEQTGVVLRTLALIALLVQIALWLNRAVTYFLRNYVRDRAEDEESGQTAYTALSFISRVVLWSMILLLILNNIPGVEITSLITGLGVTGVAVALAVQNILGDLFASLSIVLDKPFVIGDFVVVDEYAGTVKHVGLKTTRLESLSGEELVFSNGDLLSSRIRNYKRMRERRAVFEIGVVYETPYEVVKKIPHMIQEEIEEQEHTRFDRAHLREFGDSALIFEIVYYMLVPDYNTYMDTQQAVNLEIFRRFGEESIEFAYPTRTLYTRPLPEADRPPVTHIASN
jgi:small-conductance mechanosensitive channel